MSDEQRVTLEALGYPCSTFSQEEITEYIKAAGFCLEVNGAVRMYRRAGDFVFCEHIFCEDNEMDNLYMAACACLEWKKAKE